MKLVTSIKKMLELMTPPGREVLPYMGYIGLCIPKGYGFSAILVINRVSIWFLHSSLDMGMLLRSHFFIIIEKKIILISDIPQF